MSVKTKAGAIKMAGDGNRVRAYSALRAPLRGPYEALVEAAVEIILDAQARAASAGEWARELGLSRRQLEKLRAEFPELNDNG